jgi:hypothetical protein
MRRAHFLSRAAHLTQTLAGGSPHNVMKHVANRVSERPSEILRQPAAWNSNELHDAT